MALVGAGLLAAAVLFGHVWWDNSGLWVLVLGGVTVVLLTRRGQRGTDGPASETAAPAEGSSYAAPPAEPAAYTYVPAPRPPNPRKRGPILFWLGVALMAVCLGVLGIIDVAGADIVPSAYPALVLALTGALLIGSFLGRAGGLILVGLLSAVSTAGATLGDYGHPAAVTRVPTSAAAVQDDYHLNVGELVVDLTGVQDPQALDGRAIHVSAGIGHLDLRVRVVANADISGPGGLASSGRTAAG